MTFSSLDDVVFNDTMHSKTSLSLATASVNLWQNSALLRLQEGQRGYPAALCTRWSRESA
jgi:hypothetical protein